MLFGLTCFTMLTTGAAATAAGLPTQTAADLRIRLDTVGYLPNHAKRASVASPCSQFTVRNADTDNAAFTGTVSRPLNNADTGEDLYIADFSALKTPGTYYLDIPGVGRSAPFRVGGDVYNDAFTLVTHGMTLWRCGQAVSETYHGETFTHAACHTEDAYLDYVGGGHVRKDATGGWHDAGDYNKYVVNAGISVGVMLQAWEQFPDRLKRVSLGLPESGNGIPDYLDEVKYELDWVLKMQADDGSVYHKVSTLSFGGFIPPETETADRYFVPWGSPATADFVAMTAMAARIYRPFDSKFADRCLAAAQRSYDFLQAHPEDHSPDQRGFRTGGYTTTDDDDRLWAAAEMWETTGDPRCLQDLETRLRAWAPHGEGSMQSPATTGKVEAIWDWSDVADQGIFTYLLSKRRGRDSDLVDELHRDLIATADKVVDIAHRDDYARPMGNVFFWGCNGAVARQVVLLQTANRLSPNPAYVETSLDAIHHLLGRNVYGRSFVTGLGFDPPNHPHDRRSHENGVTNAWPGYLVGGAWPEATSWRDEQGHFQTNEIAINWNSAMIYALAGFYEPTKR
jgi:endoglucanase